MTLSVLCKELNNWFDKSKCFDTFTITGGVIDLHSLEESGDLQSGQWFRIVGSVFNDGVYQYPASDLVDETFDGAVWCMAVPPEVVALNNEIDAWLVKYGEELNKPYQSESFGGYSYSLKGSLLGGSGTASEPWKAQFAARLSKWRKAR